MFDIGRYANGCVPYTIGDEHDSVCPTSADGGDAQAIAGTRPRHWSRLLLDTKP